MSQLFASGGQSIGSFSYNLRGPRKNRKHENRSRDGKI